MCTTSKPSENVRSLMGRRKYDDNWWIDMASSNFFQQFLFISLSIFLKSDSSVSGFISAMGICFCLQSWNAVWLRIFLSKRIILVAVPRFASKLVWIMPDTHSPPFCSLLRNSCKLWILVSVVIIVPVFCLFVSVFVPLNANLMISGPPPYCREGPLCGPLIYFPP